jgi:mono/diheme cytochrome c family protein
MVLHGARSVATNHEPTAPGMPSFSWQLDDSKLAAVVTYVRNAWGSGAAAVSSEDVATARLDLGKRTD